MYACFKRISLMPRLSETRSCDFWRIVNSQDSYRFVDAHRSQMSVHQQPPVVIACGRNGGAIIHLTVPTP